MSKIMLMVTQPYHAADGSVLYGPGDYFDAGTDLPADVGLLCRSVIVPDDTQPVKLAEAAPTEAEVKPKRAAKAAQGGNA